MAFNGLGDERVRTGAELDVGAFVIVRMQDSGVEVAEVGMDELKKGRIAGAVTPPRNSTQGRVPGRLFQRRS